MAGKDNLVPVSQCRYGERATHLVEDDDRYDAPTYRAICGRTIRANGANWSPDQSLVCGTCIRVENAREVVCDACKLVPPSERYGRCWHKIR